jgi:hypothetical protein
MLMFTYLSISSIDVQINVGFVSRRFLFFDQIIDLALICFEAFFFDTDVETKQVVFAHDIFLSG